jgi:GNAT superfamily N-acetyltransferase
MEVRLAGPADAPALARVHVGAWRAAYAGIMPDAFLTGLDEDRFARGWEAALAEGTSFVGIGDEGRVDGFATVGGARDDGAPFTAQLWVLNVHPVGFGTGLAQALHAAALEWLAARGHEDAYLWVARDNARARRFYEREGWVADGMVQQEQFGGVALPEVRYVRELRA